MQARRVPGTWKSLLRQPRVWLLVAVCLALSLVSLRVTIDALFGSRNPALASRLIDSPRAAVRLWTLSTLVNFRDKPSPEILATSREAVLQNPMDVQGVRSRAHFYSLTGKADDARKLALLAQRITRRDQLAQILLASDRASRGDTLGAMHHLALALTVTNEGRQEIYSVMLPMLQQPQARNSFAALVTSDRSWVAEFFDFAVRKGGDNPAVVADIIAAAPPQGARWALSKNGALLLSALAEAGDANRLRRLLLAAQPALTKRVADASISAQSSSQQNGWLDWTPVEEGANGAQMGPTESGGFGALAYAGPGERQTPVLRRVLMLPPGRYRLSDRRKFVSGEQDTEFSWSVACHGPGGWKSVFRGVGTDTRPAPAFAIDRTCPLQLIQLEATTPRGGDGGQILIEDLRIVAQRPL